MQRFYITTPIYYVNGAPHIGHAYTTLCADTAARWQRLRMGAENVKFLTGIDEHGQKVLEAATARGMEPKAHCDDMALRWRSMMDELQITNDRFFRTTDPDHRKVVQSVLQGLFDAGDIYRDDYEGWYLVKDEVFVTEKEREDRLASGENKTEHFQLIQESNYFFKMSAYAQSLTDAIESDRLQILPENRKNEVLGFLRKGLGDLCISRPTSRMAWGIPLPFDEGFVTYVWFDALLNYMTAAGYNPDDRNDQSHQDWWPANYHIVGKDILTTHSVYWTTMLLAMEKHGLGGSLPQAIYAHGWWVAGDGVKIGKSNNNAIDFRALVEGYGLDAVRYFFLREIRFGADGSFSYEGFQTRYNSDLANDLGNLTHRGTSQTHKWLGGLVPALGERTELEQELVVLAVKSVDAFQEHMNHLQFNKALMALWDLVKAGNKYIDTTEPWNLNKAGDMTRLATVERHVLEICAVAAALLEPVMPTKSKELRAILGADDELFDKVMGRKHVLAALPEGVPVVHGDPLFPRFREMPEIIAKVSAVPEAEEVKEPELPELDWIEFTDFTKVMLKTGVVVHASDHPKADRLLVLKVEVGEARPRTICAGIKAKFSAEALIGRKVVVVANLKPRKMRGVMSEGMLLAAGGDEIVDLVGADAPAGEPVR